MPITPPKQFVPPTLLTPNPTALYTAPANIAGGLIKKCTLVNSSSSPVSVSLYIAPGGVAASATNIVLSAATVLAGQTREVYEIENHVVPTAGTLQASCTTAGVCSMLVTGVEFGN
jgi:hypothetical protein